MLNPSGDGTFSSGLTHVARAIDGDEAAAVVRELYGFDAAPVRLGGEKDANFRVSVGGANYLLKIVAGEEPSVCNMHTEALLHVERTDPDLPIQRIVRTRDGDAERVMSFGVDDIRVVRLVTYVEGAMQRSTTQTPVQRKNAGTMLARLQIALADFRHPSESHKLTWDMRHAGDLVSAAECLEDGDRLSESLFRFRERVLRRSEELPFQAVHNDLNSDNIVVDPRNTDHVVGIIDFGDMVRTARVFDLAVGAAYQATGAEDPFGACLDFISGFSQRCDLLPFECDILADAILARMAMRIVITERRAELFPENRSYILRNTPQARLQFDRLYRQPADQMTAAIHSIIQSTGVN